MDMIPVVSKAVRAVGYDPAAKLLRIQFQTGSVYDYADQSQQVYWELMAAKSKGRFVAERLVRGRPYLEAVERPTPELLETFAEDDCCRLRILNAAHAGKLQGKDSWMCPKCGMEWRAEYLKLDMGEPCAKHWEPKPLIAVF